MQSSCNSWKKTRPSPACKLHFSQETFFVAILFHDCAHCVMIRWRLIRTMKWVLQRGLLWRHWWHYSTIVICSTCWPAQSSAFSALKLYWRSQTSDTICPIFFLYYVLLVVRIFLWMLTNYFCHVFAEKRPELLRCRCAWKEGPITKRGLVLQTFGRAEN